MHSIRILRPASKELEKLDTSVARRIVERVEWLATNLDSAKLYPLKGKLGGFFKIREGSYRIIFEILRNEQTIIIHSVGHRRDIYKQKQDQPCLLTGPIDSWGGNTRGISTRIRFVWEDMDGTDPGLTYEEVIRILKHLALWPIEYPGPAAIEAWASPFDFKLLRKLSD